MISRPFRNRVLPAKPKASFEAQGWKLDYIHARWVRPLAPGEVIDITNWGQKHAMVEDGYLYARNQTMAQRLNDLGFI